MATISVDLTSGSDDGFEPTGSFWESEVSLDLVCTDVYGYTTWGAGFRFPGVTVPAGTTITSATLTVYGIANGSVPSPIDTDIYCEDVDSGTAGKLSTKTLTTAKTDYTITSTFVPNASYQTYSIDITSAVQEVLSRAGWASGNAINVIIKKITAAAGKHWDIYDVDGGYDAPSKNLTITLPSVALTGTVTASITEADIVAGGKTIILTLTGDTWVTAGATFDAQRQNIINGLDSAQAEATGWDAEVKAKEVVGAVVRTSDTVVTITLSAEAAYDITANETITATIPATALTGAAALVASPTFTITPEGGATRRIFII